MKKIAIIGGGFGGIAAAIRLRARGNQVTIYERLNKLGGRAQVFQRKDYQLQILQLEIRLLMLSYQMKMILIQLLKVH